MCRLKGDIIKGRLSHTRNDTGGGVYKQYMRELHDYNLRILYSPFYYSPDLFFLKKA